MTCLSGCLPESIKHTINRTIREVLDWHLVLKKHKTLGFG